MLLDTVTTDVQGILFTRIHVDIYFIQCSYLSGSDVRGCVYVLVSREEGVENVTGFIERDINGVTLEVANIGCYGEVIAYDSATINEILPVRTSITDEVCIITTSGIIMFTVLRAFSNVCVHLDSLTIAPTSPSSGTLTPTITALISVVVVVVVVAVVLAVMLIIVSFVLYQNKGKSLYSGAAKRQVGGGPFVLSFLSTVDPRLSGPRLSSTSIIRHHFRVNLLIDFAV